MIASGPATTRQPLHRRQVDVQVFRREDGLWDVEASLADVRSHDVKLLDVTRPAGQPIHDLALTLVVDRQLDVLWAGSRSPGTPHPGVCDALGKTYERLVGLNLLRGFRRAVQARLGGVQGCTHLTELAQLLPTAVIQALAGDVLDTRGTAADAARPFQIDRCHALRSDGAIVRMHYPRWASPGADPSSPTASEGTP